MTSGDPHLIQLWLYILLSVNHAEQRIWLNGTEITLQPGQGVFGLNQIVRALTRYHDETKKNFMKNRTCYYRKLKILEKLQNVKLKTTNKYTIITVLNWDSYQQNETQVKLKRNAGVTNKNDKNDKKEYINVPTVDDPKEGYLHSARELSEYAASDFNLPSEEIMSVVKTFEPVNPLIATQNPAEYQIAAELIKQYGYEKIKRSAEYAVAVQGERYAPVITTPHKLKHRLGDLRVYYQREKNKKGFNNLTIAT